MTGTGSLQADGGAAPGRRRWLWKLAIALLVIAAVAVASIALPLREYVTAALEWTQGLGYWGPVVVVVLFYVVTVSGKRRTLRGPPPGRPPAPS